MTSNDGGFILIQRMFVHSLNRNLKLHSSLPLIKVDIFCTCRYAVDTKRFAPTAMLSLHKESTPVATLSSHKRFAESR